MAVENIVFESGSFVIHRSQGAPSRYPIADMLRAADIPAGLTYTQVAALTALANLIAILVRTLIERKVLDESFVDGNGDMDWDLDHIIYAIEQMGGKYHDPDFDDLANA